jgi:hypothetical protein
VTVVLSFRTSIPASACEERYSEGGWGGGGVERERESVVNVYICECVVIFRGEREEGIFRGEGGACHALEGGGVEGEREELDSASRQHTSAYVSIRQHSLGKLRGKYSACPYVISLLTLLTMNVNADAITDITDNECECRCYLIIYIYIYIYIFEIFFLNFARTFLEVLLLLLPLISADVF